MKLYKFYILLFCFLFSTSCSDLKTESLKNNLVKRSKITKDFKKVIKNFYNFFLRENCEQAKNMINDSVFVINQRDESYDIMMLGKQQAFETVYIPGEKIDTFYISEFPKFNDNTIEGKQWVYIDNYNSGELQQLRYNYTHDFSKKKFDTLEKKITIKVFDTHNKKILYWGKEKQDWKLLIIEILE